MDYEITMKFFRYNGLLNVLKNICLGDIRANVLTINVLTTNVFYCNNPLNQMIIGKTYTRVNELNMASLNTIFRRCSLCDKHNFVLASVNPESIITRTVVFGCLTVFFFSGLDAIRTINGDYLQIFP